MGIFSTFSSSPSTPSAKAAEEVRSGARAPSRTEREACWAARDGYFGCLDRHGVVDALSADGVKKAAKMCKAEGEDFERDCAKAWVSCPPPPPSLPPPRPRFLTADETNRSPTSSSGAWPTTRSARRSSG